MSNPSKAPKRIYSDDGIIEHEQQVRFDAKKTADELVAFCENKVGYYYTLSKGSDCNEARTRYHNYKKAFESVIRFAMEESETP